MGGGVSVIGGTLTFINSTITFNRATLSDPAVSTRGGTVEYFTTVSDANSVHDDGLLDGQFFLVLYLC